MPKVRHTLNEDVGDPKEWTFTWEITDDVTLGSACGFCGRSEQRLTYEVVRGADSHWICQTCVARYPVKGYLDGMQLDPISTRDQVHGLTARIKQQTCQEAIRKLQGLTNDPEIDEILVYFDRNLQLSPRRAARLFAALPLLAEPFDPRVFEIRTRSAEHQSEYGSLDETSRVLVWPALSSVQRRRMIALGYAPAGVSIPPRNGRRSHVAPQKLPERRMPALSEPTILNREKKSFQ